ncbi:MAG: hypothetical protein HY720_00060 [Planctomycetes bacterium]|nr:hypothetical protein [Planctomycetota bacterium]
MRAKVTNGRLVVEGPVDLPEGMVLDLVIDDEGDDLTDGERDRLHAAMNRAWESAQAGRVKPAQDVLRHLRERRAD